MLEKKYELRGAACDLDARNSGKSPKQIRVANYARGARVSRIDPIYRAALPMLVRDAIGAHRGGVLRIYVGREINSNIDSWINPEFHDPVFAIRPQIRSNLAPPSFMKRGTR